MFSLNTEYWTAEAWLKTRRKELPDQPLLGNGNSVNLSLYLNHCYTHISKQILEYIFLLNKYIESWDAVLINQLTTAIFAAVNNLTIIFYTKLRPTKVWFSIFMIQAITYTTYWFTVANTGQRKLFHQICICSKAMQ